ncbi:MAG TPA: NAD-dependent epimerase/dehydratase family protein [Puia sp.]|jgi:nucleoside-diphosphate-sugar epimerase|nr:NAD-dependent epimerase/dehydratase family protein [Puia sp.]
MPASFHTILGANGIIADSLARELTGLPVRLVSRHPKAIAGATIHPADITDPAQTLDAIRDSAVVYCCIGLPYNYSIWRQQWPRIIDNIIAACRQTQAKLLFFDNVYMYGQAPGPMTEETPYNPTSRKGDLRARIATQLMSEVRKGNIIAAIARSADFYGPGAGKTSIPSFLVTQRLIKGQRAQWLVNAHVPHSFTFVPDAVKALRLLALDDNAWNQVWHLPTATNPLTGADFIEKAAAELKKASQYTVLPKWMIRLGGIFDRMTAELYEMLYQYEFDYVFDSTKFETAYSFKPTAYQQGIHEVTLAAAAVGRN